MAAAFPNGELAIAHRPTKRRKGAAAGTYEQDLPSNDVSRDPFNGLSADALDGGSNEAWGLVNLSSREATPGHVTAIVAGSGDAGGVAGSGGGAAAAGGGGAAAGGATAADNAEKSAAVAAAGGGAAAAAAGGGAAAGGATAADNAEKSAAGGVGADATLAAAAAG